jgi:CheY-like chemotaxis protein
VTSSLPSALRILVVDDDERAAAALGRLLRSYGHDVHVAYSAASGLELAVKLNPHLILHDLAMVPIDGYEAARRLREFPSLSQTLLIACSGSIDEARATAAGYARWLHKPISAGDLEAVIQIAWGRLGSMQSNSHPGAHE